MIRLARCIVFLLLLLPSIASAAWPTYLGDRARGGYTSDKLPAKLSLSWVYSTPAAPELAWEGPRAEPIEGLHMRHRVAFDAALQVVGDGRRVYFGSSVDHKVYCRDAASGQEIWSFFTEGPVRLAPTLAGGRVYVGSDDGFVYCLAAEDGAVVWKLRLGPKDDRVLARGRMISRWPVRTGVLVDDGVAYFAAGIFPHEHIYLVAARAADGKIIWRNDTISQQDAGRNDLSPQGYLLASDELLFVPSGRSLPTAIDKQTGKIVHQRKYGWRSTAGGVVGGTKALLADGQLYASGPHQFMAMDQASGKVGHAWIPGQWMVIDGDKAYIATDSAVIAVRRAEHAKASTERQKLYLQQSAARRDPKRLAEIRKQMAELAAVGILWKADFVADGALIAAGNAVIAGGENKVAVFDAASGEMRFSAGVKGAAHGLAVAGGALMVSTDQGKVYGFTNAANVQPAAVVLQYPNPAQQSANPFPEDKLTAVYAAAAEEIIKRTGQRRGFCLVAGSQHGRLAHELARRTDLRIYGIEPDAAKAEASRRALESAGLFGSRVTIVHAKLDEIPFSNYFANLLVSDTLLLTGKLPFEPRDIARHVKPCGGKLCLGMPAGAAGAASGNSAQTLSDVLGKLFVGPDAEVAVDSSWVTLTRGKLPGAGDWSHQYGNAANTSFSRDYRLKGHLGVLWYGDPGPSNMINRHEAAAAPLSTNGRMFIQGTEKIMAYDAYNGTFLWDHKNPGAIRTGVFNNKETSNLAATDDVLYVAVGDTCTALDAGTGKIVAEYQTPQSPDGIERAWGYLAHHDGVLYGTSTIRSELAKSLRRRGLVIDSTTDAVFAVDPKTKQRRWVYRGKNILHTTIAIGDGRMFFIDSSLSTDERQALYRQEKPELAKLTGEAAKKAEAEIKKKDIRLAVALDLATGKSVWQKTVDVTDTTNVSSGGGALAVMYQDGHVVLCGANANGHYWRQFLSGQFSRRRLVVLDAANGNKLWSKDANYMNRPTVVDNRIIAEPWSFDLHSGEETKREHPLTGELTKWQFSRPGHHCGVITATPNMMFFRSGFIGYYDLYEDSGTRHFSGQRLGCWINVLPAGGLVVIPEASAGCVCLFSIASTVVLEPQEQRDSWGIYSAAGPRTPVEHMALNLGAPGDRRDDRGRMWFGYPRPHAVGRMEFVFDLKPQLATGGGYYHRGSEFAKVTGADVPWVATSGARGLSRLELPLLGKDDPPANYTVKLHFADLDNSRPGQRVFAIRLAGQTVAEGVDVAAESGAAGRALVREFKNVRVERNLAVELVSRSKAPTSDELPILSGIEVKRQGE